MNQFTLFVPSDLELVRGLSQDARVDRAIALLRDNEPPEGYYMPFSGGKDSCAIKALAILSGVKFEAWYNNTTIDPPELVRFLRQHHKEVKWNNPEMPMMRMVAEADKTPPTRRGRWCCEVYKEGGGKGRVRIQGVRAAESPKRKASWFEVAADRNGDKVICPIVCWTDTQLWDFIRTYQVKYCELYDQGINRIGCVGCMLQSRRKQDAEFARWPNFERNWKAAIIKNWDRLKDKPRQDGKPRYQAMVAKL